MSIDQRRSKIDGEKEGPGDRGIERRALRPSVPLSLRVCALAVLVLLVATLPLAAAPRDELLRLVPRDAGFCVVLQDLRTHARKVLDSPCAEQLRKSSLGQMLVASPELKKLANVEQEIKKHFDVDAARLLDDIYGDAVVLAYRPAPDGKPENEEGIFLVRARDADLLAKLVQKFNDLQIQSGELKQVQERKHEGATYHVRIEPSGQHFYYVSGSILAFTSKESMLKQVIELERREVRDEPALVRDMRRLGVHEAMLVWWINPRAFDAELKRKAAQAKPPEAHGLERIQLYWQALEGAAFTLSPKKSGLEISLAFLARDGDIPEPARKFFAGDNQPSELWSRFPADAILTVADRADVPALAEFLGDFLPPADRAKLREAFDRYIARPSGGLRLKDILPNLGPDWGYCLLPPDAKDKAPLPQVLAALRVRPGDGKKPVDRALYDVLDNFARIAVSLSADPVSLESVLNDKTEIKYLDAEKLAPLGLQPAYALAHGYLLLSTSPTSIKKFGPAVAVAASADCPLVRLSFRSLRTYLKTRADEIAPYLAAKHQMQADEAKRRLHGLIEFCQFFDRLELSRRTAPGQVALTLRLDTEQPLMK